MDLQQRADLSTQSEVTRNAEAANLVRAQLVWLIATRDLNESGREFGNKAACDRSGGGAPGLVPVQKQDNFLEVFLQEFLLPE